MLATDRVQEIFADAYGLHHDALNHLAAGEIRAAAGKAWDATLGATNALILARTGKAPEKLTDTSGNLDLLAGQDPAVKTLIGRYCARWSRLYGDCYLLGILDYPEGIERRIRETAGYIQDAENLADPQPESPAASD